MSKTKVPEDSVLGKGLLPVLTGSSRSLSSVGARREFWSPSPPLTGAGH